ncbi:MAG: hypothetical protein HPY76_01725 [Anaerolineae bacterium]|jgi:hypothetical protein|nr:hypothetical protein [Anaerolineae bacterium]
MPIQTNPSLPEMVAYLNSLENRLVQTENENEQLRKAVYQLKHGYDAIKIDKKELRIPAIALLSPNFLTRAFAVWGLNFVAQLIISVVAFIFFLVISLLISSDAILRLISSL